mmetsp:Transcript_45869/g.116511  ORF Transcript_45869/g.116511 Transcript_45869/m.116511 type:complete len:303 (+) Transcript_45869:586-1494(+)
MRVKVVGGASTAIAACLICCSPLTLVVFEPPPRGIPTFTRQSVLRTHLGIRVVLAVVALRVRPCQRRACAFGLAVLVFAEQHDFLILRGDHGESRSVGLASLKEIFLDGPEDSESKSILVIGEHLLQLLHGHVFDAGELDAGQDCVRIREHAENHPVVLIRLVGRGLVVRGLVGRVDHCGHGEEHKIGVIRILDDFAEVLDSILGRCSELFLHILVFQDHGGIKAVNLHVEVQVLVRARPWASNVVHHGLCHVGVRVHVAQLANNIVRPNSAPLERLASFHAQPRRTGKGWKRRLAVRYRRG